MFCLCLIPMEKASALSKDTDIDSLFKEMNRISSERNNYLLDGNDEGVKLCDEKLQKLGLKEVTSEEIAELDNDFIKSTRIQARVAIPYSKNCTWKSTGWITYTYVNGEKYQIKTLIAYPNAKKSALKGTGNYSINKASFKSGVKFGVEQAKAIGSGLVSSAVKGSSYLFTFYDIVKGLSSVLSSTTDIADAKAIVSYSYTQNIAFNYVRKMNGSGEKYTMYTNQLDVAYGVQVPTFTTKKGYATPKIVQKNVKAHFTTDTYNNPKWAVASYLRSPFKVHSHCISMFTIQTFGTRKEIGFERYNRPSAIK